MTARRARGSRARTVFIGSGGFGLPSFRALAGHPGIDLVGAVSAPARPSGRGLAPATTPITDAATALGVPVLTPVRLRDPDAIDAVLGLDPSLVVLADYGRIVPAALLGRPHGALNLHPSLLPRHRGATPVPATILAGDEMTGVSLIRMDEGIDTGPLIAQARTTVRPGETAPELEARLAEVAAGLLTTSLDPWLAGELPAEPQADAFATVTKPLRREDGRLDPTRSAVDLERQVRAYQPWPGSFLDTARGRLTVWHAAAGPSEHEPAGRFGPRGVSTADGLLVLHEVQPAGGRRMPWVEYLRGRSAIVGSFAHEPVHDA
ncbi:MAG TPA: methionyl-tRNA formyltransferase [Candidatus Limnocylindrales bacterium]|nr:methionyl-tRNA formyltransferase [Candidatus Limnocylindrales bacterium]